MTLEQEEKLRSKRSKVLDSMLDCKVKAYIRTDGGSGFWIHGILHREEGFGYSIKTCTGLYKIVDSDNVKEIEYA
jgi:hypothetical protein